MSSGTAYKILQYLQSYDLQGKGPEYNCNSPLRAGSNSHGFTVTITDDEHGAWFDHVTGEKGSLYELAEKLGIETPKLLPPNVAGMFTRPPSSRCSG